MINLNNQQGNNNSNIQNSSERQNSSWQMIWTAVAAGLTVAVIISVVTYFFT